MSWAIHTPTGELKQAVYAYEGAPIGAIMAHTGQSAPQGWVLANGQTLKEDDYPLLVSFAASESAAGNPIWSATVTGSPPTRQVVVPDLRDRFIYGGGGSKALNAKAGTETWTLTASQLPAHTHNVVLTDPGHVHSNTNGSYLQVSATVSTFLNTTNNAGYAVFHAPNTATAFTGISVAVNDTGQTRGTVINSMPPYIALSWIIKAKGASLSNSVITGPQGPKGDPPDPTPMDTWHTVGDGATGLGTTFQNGWVNVGGAYAPLAFRKDPNGKVRIRGSIKTGTINAVVFTLPVGYRPVTAINQPTSSYNGTTGVFGQVEIQPTGTVAVYYASNSYFSLDGIEFDTDTVTQLPIGSRGVQGPSGSTSYDQPSCRVATTGNVTISAPGAAIDGVTLSNGDLVLVWLQTNGLENGLYVFNGAAAAMTRIGSAAAGAIIEAGVRVYVYEGTLFGQRDFYTKTRVTIGGANPLLFSPPRGSSIAFSRMNGLGAGTASPGWTTTNNNQVIFSPTPTTPATMVYTPPVNVEFEVAFHLRLTKVDAAYSYAYPGIRITPVDRDGVGGPAGSHQYSLRMQHSQVQTYEPYEQRKTYRLAAGTAYTADLIWTCSAGTWDIVCNAQEFWMEYRAFVAA